MAYQHLSHEERRILIQQRCQGKSLAEIGRILERHPSTLSRELRRNLHDNGDHCYYTHSMADQKARARRHKSRRHSQYTTQEWQRIESLIILDWSPEQISNHLKGQKSIRISHESIYQYIYRDKKAGGRLYTHLRLRCKKQRKRYGTYERRGILAGKRMITERPAHIENRLEPGHWEADTVLGTGTKDCIVTLVERATGLTMIGKAASRTKEDVNQVIIRLIRQHTHPVKTITSDNGTEFHGYKDIELATGVVFYFAIPHHAWERGTNENTNGLIRQYIPKYTSMKHITQTYCDVIAEVLNLRPRKRLGFKTPLEVYEHN